MCQRAWMCVRSTYRLSCKSSLSTRSGAMPSAPSSRRTRQQRKRRVATVSVLVVGLSHKSGRAPVLARAAVSGDALGKLLHDVALLPDIAETFVISTCNRVEVYAEVGRFHGGVAGVCELLSRDSGIPAHELTSCLYVHYEDRAVQHLLAVSSGLESMVVGEDQILGQVRSALKLAGDQGTLGGSLRALGRLALRTGKRARAETGIDRLGLSLVSVGIGLAVPGLSD